MLNFPQRNERCLGRRLQSVALRYRFRVGYLLTSSSTWPKRTQRTAFATTPPTATSSRSTRMAQLEAVLFIAREPLSTRKLAQLADLADGTEARTLVRALNHLYDAEQRAFQVVEVAGGIQLRTRPQFAPWLRRLCSVQPEVRLSGPALETLAVVAYRQPVLRVTVEAVRGVQCGEILRQLMERDLVKIVGRSEELGRPYLYGTTKQFLQVFGLRSLEELPRREQLRLDEPLARPIEERDTTLQESEVPSTDSSAEQTDDSE